MFLASVSSSSMMSIAAAMSGSMDGKFEDDFGSLAGFAGDRHRPAEARDYTLDQREAQTEALALGREKGREHARELLARDADAIVANGHPDRVRLGVALCRDLQQAAPGH